MVNIIYQITERNDRTIIIMSDVIREKVMIAEQWCEDMKKTSPSKEDAENETTYCESGAVITGEREGAEKLDRELKKALDAGSPEEAFKKAPLNGGLSVMTMARTKAGFNPTNIDDVDANSKFL